MQFISSSIIYNDSIQDTPDLDKLKSYYSSINNLGNFSKKTKLNKLTDAKFPNLNVPSTWIDRFIDIFKKITTNKLRTIKELRYLLNFIYKKKIKLFLGINLEKYGLKNTSAYYVNYSNSRFIVLNADTFFDIDYLCQTLTHELIHFLQNHRPLNLEIDDSVVSGVMENYKESDSIGLRTELEAYTYQKCPNFIENFNKNQFILKDIFYATNKRIQTIKWITSNKRLPNYSNSSKPLHLIDLRKNSLDELIISDLRPKKIYFPNRLIR